MTKSTRIFVDTSAWIALLLKNETHHKPVTQYFSQESAKNSKFFTSDYVLDEAWTRLITHTNFHLVQSLKDMIDQAVKEQILLVLYTDQTIFTHSWAIFTKYQEHQLSFTDATIISFAQNLKIDEILTLDQGFTKAGITIKPYLSN